MTTATAPVPGPGILDIAPYVGGDSQAPGGLRPIRLASNESALGPSPKAIAAYRALAEEIHRYPDGSAAELRAVLGRHHGLDPARIVCGSGSDELIGLLQRAYAGPGSEVLYSRHSFLMYPIGAMSVGADPGCRPRAQPDPRCRRLSGAGHRPHPDRLCRQPEQPDRDLSVRRRTGAPACRPAAPCRAGNRRCLCRIRQPKRLRAGDRAGQSRRKRRDAAHLLEDLCARRACASAGPIARRRSPT